LGLTAEQPEGFLILIQTRQQTIGSRFDENRVSGGQGLGMTHRLIESK
jgi:hypothetical protein